MARGDLTDAQYERLRPLLPSCEGQPGHPYADHRKVINGILWRLRTGAPWRDIPDRYGPHQTCYDRLVLDMTGRAPGFDVRYVTTVLTDGGGFPVPVAGGARLAVVAKKGATSIPSMPSVAGFTTFRQVRWAGSFEGYTTVALGVRARLPFRTFTLYDASTNRSRLVVDVAHRW